MRDARSACAALGAIEAMEKHDLKVSDLALALKGFRARLPGEKAPLVRIASVEVKGAGADLASGGLFKILDGLHEHRLRGCIALKSPSKTGLLFLIFLASRDSFLLFPKYIFWQCLLSHQSYILKN